MKKMMICAMCFIGCVTMFVPSTHYVKANPKKTSPGTAIFVMAIPQIEPTIEEKRIIIKRPEIHLDIRIPQFKNMQDEANLKKLNQLLYKQANERKQQMFELAKEYNKDIIKDGLSPILFEYLETYSVISTIKPYLTIETNRYQYSGGAHGINELSYINWNTETNKQVYIGDLFKKDVDYLQLINTLVKEEISRRSALGEYFFSGSDGFQTIQQTQPFYINKEGDLMIVFNVYEIAPYASGPIYIKLPLMKLAPYLN